MGHPPTRAARRHHKFRVREYARRVFPEWSGAWLKADNLKSCGKSCCANPRAWAGEGTVQERRASGVADAASCPDRAEDGPDYFNWTAGMSVERFWEEAEEAWW